MTGSRRTPWSFIVRSVSSKESSAPIVTGLPSARAETFVDEGSPPSAMHFTTMSRSVIIPCSRLSSPQIGSAPTSRSRIFFAASTRESFTDAHSTPPVMISRAVVIAPPSLRRSYLFGVPRCTLVNPLRLEPPQPQAVGHDEHGREAHRRAGDQGVQQAQRCQRQRRHVVGEGPEEVSFDRAEGPSGEPNGIGDGSEITAHQREV